MYVCPNTEGKPAAKVASSFPKLNIPTHFSLGIFIYEIDRELHIGRYGSATQVNARCFQMN